MSGPVIGCQELTRRAELLDAAGECGIALGGGVIRADGLGDLGEVPLTAPRKDADQPGGGATLDYGQDAIELGEALLDEESLDELVEGRDAVIIEARGARAEDRHLLPWSAECPAVADDLPRDIAPGILCTAPLVLVHRDHIGEVEHVDLLELRRRPEFRSHHVEGDIAVRDDRSVALTDARGLDDDDVEASGLAGGDDVVEGVGDLMAGITGGKRSEEDDIGIDAVHPDAVAEEGPATPSAGRVDREDGDAKLVLAVAAQAADELVGER